MKRIIYLTLLFVLGFLSLYLAAQPSYEVRMTNFEQVSEIEFRYDIELRNNATDPVANAWAYNDSQFQIDINPAAFNGGELFSLYMTVDNTNSGLVTNQQLDPVFDFLYSGPNTALITNSPSMSTDQEVTLFNDNSWKPIGRFIVVLRDNSNSSFHNWADVHPEFAFRFDDTKVFGCAYYMDGAIARRGISPGVDGGSYEISDKTLTLEIPDRQLAGYCFTGTSDWLTTESWNNALASTHPAYHQVPGGNSNALINGNVTIADGQDISLLPDGGNGGEVTVLTGSEPLYTLTVEEAGEYPGEITFRVRIAPLGDYLLGSSTTWVPSGSSVEVPAGVQYRVYTRENTGGDLVFSGWSSTPAVSFTNLAGSGSEYNARFDMPSADLTVNSTWELAKSPSSNNLPYDSEERKNESLFDSDEHTDDISNNGILKSSLTDGLYASLTIAPGGSLTVDKLFNDNENGAGAIVLQSADGLPNGSLIHTNMGTEASVEQYLTKEVWHMIGQPVAFTTIDLFDFPPGGPLVWLYAHDESTNSFPSGGGSSIWQLGTPMELGKGYLSFMQNVPDPATGEKVTFSGELNAGDYTTGVEGYYALEYTQGFASAGYNFISNPYPSSLNATIDLWPKTNVDNSVWIWEGVGGESGGGQYRYWNGIDGTNGWGLGTITDGIIPPMQGFFIKANDVNPSMTIPQDSRTHGSQPFYKSSQMPDNTLRIDAEGAGGTDAIFVRFDEAATTGYDPQFDVHKMFGSESLPQLYTELTWQKLSVSTIPGMDMYQSVPMGFHCSTQGIFTLTASGLESFGLEDSIYLEDLKEGTIQCLNDNPQYSFVNSGDSPATRFLIHFGLMDLEDEPEITEANIYAYGDIIHVDLYSPGPGLVTVHNILGQELHATSIEGNSTNTIRIKGKGIYIVRLTDQEGALIGKKKVSIN